MEQQGTVIDADQGAAALHEERLGDLWQRTSSMLNRLSVSAGVSPDHEPDEHAVDDPDELFRLANRFTLLVRSAVGLTLGASLLLANAVFRLGLPVPLLLFLSLFEVVANQPYPFLRRRLGTDKRLYLLNTTLDVFVLITTAYLLGGLVNRFAVLLFLLAIVVVGAMVLRLFSYWTAFLSGLASILLAILGEQGLALPLPAVIMRLPEINPSLFTSGHAFYSVLLTLFVSVPVAKLRQDIKYRRETEQSLRASKEELAHRAFYDSLTGLPNRALFLQRLEDALGRAHERKGTVAVLFLDLDRFKQVNDTLGHTAGDALLVAVAGRLQGCLREEDTAARFGGDEFMILVEQAEQGESVSQLAERILETLRQPYKLDGQELETSASLGIALSEQGGKSIDDPADLLRQADIALHRTKAAGRAGLTVFDTAMHQHVVQRVTLETDLRQAVARNELRLVYQPLIELQNGRVSGVEALVRWQHPRRGLLAPEEFVPAAEEMGLILPIGHWVLTEACRQMKAWSIAHATGAPNVMSVNLSPRQFQQPDLVEQIAAMLAAVGLPPSCLEIEITEGVMIQNAEAALRAVDALKALGVRMAIDDFGTGYSSLSYVQRFAVDTLKIDQSFVRDLGRGGPADAIMQAVTTLAHAVGSEVTAEGIETAAQLAAVEALGCDRGQGYYFSRPVPAGVLHGMLVSRHGVSLWPTAGQMIAANESARIIL